MQRRSVLRGLVALGAGASAGCTVANREVPATAPEPPSEVRSSGGDGGAGGDSESDDGGEGGVDTPDRQRFAVPDWSFEAAEDGHLLVEVAVENRSETAHEAVMTVTIRADDKTFSPAEYVALQPGERRDVRIHVPVPYSEFDADPGFGVQFDPGRPATSLPEGTVTPYPGDRETATGDSTDATGRSTDANDSTATDAGG